MNTKEMTLYRAKLHFVSRPLADIPAKVREEFERIADTVRPGMRIALGIGSRGISNTELIAKTLVACIRERGAEPFIIPAMGSHGGATAEGQREVLRSYGVTEEACGAPVIASMEVVKIGEIGGDRPAGVYMDRNAYVADGVIVMNRVKAHTDFHGAYESGIVKMLTIGLGKQAQALAVHKYGANGLRDLIPEISRVVLKSGKILGGLAILEDGYENTADLRMALPEEFYEVDHEVLLRSKEMMPHLPFDRIDVLIVEQMGKNISGTGMDPNIIGRVRIEGQEDALPFCSRIVVLGLTPESHGNALGIGLADVTTRAVADEIDWEATYANVVTSGFLQRGFLPIVAKDEKEAVSIALRTCGGSEEGYRVVRIRDTLHIDEIRISESLIPELLASGLGEIVR